MKLATINNPALNAAYGTPGGSGGAPGRIEALLTILLGVITVFGFVYFIAVHIYLWLFCGKFFSRNKEKIIGPFNNILCFIYSCFY